MITGGTSGPRGQKSESIKAKACKTNLISIPDVPTTPIVKIAYSKN